MVLIQRLLIFLLLTATIITGVAFAVAQTEPVDDPMWSAYIYSASSGLLTKVSTGGERTNYTLDVPENTYIAGNDIAFTSDGTKAAYCALNSSALYEESEASFVLRDIAGERDITRINIGRAIACRVDPSSLNADESLVAVAVMNKIPDAEQFRDNPAPAASLMIIDVESGETVASIDTDHPAFVDLAVTGGAVMFYVREFDEEGVTFGLLPWFIGGPDVFKLFHWSIETDEVRDAGVWQHSQDIFNGQTAFLSYDEDLPVALYDGPISPANQVQVQTGDRPAQTVLTDSENLPINVAFIKGGDSIAVLLLEGMQSPVPSSNVTLLEIQLDEEETVFSEPEIIGTYSGYLVYRGTSDGVAVLSQNVNAPSTSAEYRLTLIEDGESQVLWSMETAFGAPLFELVWSTPME